MLVRREMLSYWLANHGPYVFAHSLWAGSSVNPCPQLHHHHYQRLPKHTHPLYDRSIHTHDGSFHGAHFTISRLMSCQNQFKHLVLTISRYEPKLHTGRVAYFVFVAFMLACRFWRTLMLVLGLSSGICECVVLFYFSCVAVYYFRIRCMSSK